VLVRSPAARSSARACSSQAWVAASSNVLPAERGGPCTLHPTWRPRRTGAGGPIRRTWSVPTRRLLTWPQQAVLGSAVGSGVCRRRLGRPVLDGRELGAVGRRPPGRGRL